MAFIIGLYNKYDQWDRQHQRYTFEVNGQWYAILEVELEWGQPQMPLRVQSQEQEQKYQVYDKFEDAMKFVRQIKQLN